MQEERTDKDRDSQSLTTESIVLPHLGRCMKFVGKTSREYLQMTTMMIESEEIYMNSHTLDVNCIFAHAICLRQLFSNKHLALVKLFPHIMQVNEPVPALKVLQFRT